MERMTMPVEAAPRAGEHVELAVGEAVHGGWCVCRQNDTGWVIFVRHALPGERVVARITQVTARFARADAVQILAASPDRVTPACPYAGPGGCGGCDWQHASLESQRALKAGVIRQQLQRLAGLDFPVQVESVPGDQAGLGWRTSVSFAVDDDGGVGLRRHRSREVVEIDACLIAHPVVVDAGVIGARWPGAEAVHVDAVPETGECGVRVSGRAGGRRPPALPDLTADSVQFVGRAGTRTPMRGRGYVTRKAAGRDWRVSLGGFWQVHPGAADTLASAVLDALDPQPGATALDLYSGAGLFAGVLARAVGPAGRVTAIEEDRAAVRDARHNLREWSWATVHRGDVARLLAVGTGVNGASLVVLDPPRTGAARPVIDALCGRGHDGSAAAELRRIAYVSCDPATLARDLRLLLEGGWRLEGLRGFDAFPMTHHVECLATLSRGQGPN
jgi:tRNA/tmRNA/rRNA uracil-C5-methylase (TrmA/RlmC/RlmD family)